FTTETTEITELTESKSVTYVGELDLTLSLEAGYDPFTNRLKRGGAEARRRGGLVKIALRKIICCQMSTYEVFIFAPLRLCASAFHFYGTWASYSLKVAPFFS